MYLDGLIQRKIAALLQPWLAEEPLWVVKLGFLRSTFVARNLRFDTSALNGLFEPGVRLRFKDVTVEELSVRVALWSDPAFEFKVQGFHVTLFAEETVSPPMPQPSDTSLLGQRKLLRRIDPEGSALHDNLEKIIENCSSESLMRHSLVNLILSKCRLSMHGVCLRMEFPSSDEDFSLRWDVGELNAQCQNVENRCLMGAFIRSLFLPLREGSFEVAAEGMEVAITGKGEDGCIFSSKKPCIGIRLKNLCLVNLMISAQNVNFAYSPSLLPMFSALVIIVPAEPKYIRNGRQLWKCARNKLYDTILPRRYLLYQATDLALLSLRLVKAYQNFLVIIGCSIEKPPQKMVFGVSRDRRLLQSAVEEWKLVSEIERQLHAETVAWARRVARSRVISQTKLAEDRTLSCGDNPLFYLQRVFYLILVAWSTICRIFGNVLSILFQKYSSNTVSKVQLWQESSTLLFCFTLNLGVISVEVSPANAMNFVSNKANQWKQIPSSNLVSFCLLFKGVLFLCEDRICEQYVSFSVGSVEAVSASISNGFDNAVRFRKNPSFKEIWKEATDRKMIVWAEPTKLLVQPGESDADPNFDTKSADTLALKKLWREMPLMWQQLCARFEESDVLSSGNPFILCNLRTFWLYPDLRCPDLGLWKCSLGVGKLYFALGYSEMLSIIVLLNQTLRNFSESSCSADSGSFWTRQAPQKAQQQGRSKFSIKDVKLALCELLPVKPIELEAVIAGPHVHISLRKDESLGHTSMASEDGFDLKTVSHNINLAVWLATDSGRLNVPDSETFELDEPAFVAISGSDSKSFVSQGNYSLGYYISYDGLRADFVGSKGSQETEVLVLKPVIIKLSHLRDYLHSFCTTVIASSADLCVYLQGGFLFFSTEELSVVFQVFEGLFSRAAVQAFGDSAFGDNKGRVAPTKHVSARAKSASKIGMISAQDRDGTTLSSVATSCVITCTLEIDPINVILHDPGKSHSDRFPILSRAPSSRNLGLSKLPPYGIWLSTCKMSGEVFWSEHNIEMHADFSGFQAALIKLKGQVSDIIGHLDHESFLQLIVSLYEVSLSSSSIDLSLDFPEETSSPEKTRAAELGTGSSSSPLATKNWLLLKVTYTMIFVGRSSTKNLFSGTHESNTVLSLSVGKDIQTICSELKDGLIYIEPAVLAAFASSFNSYLQYFRRFLFFELPRDLEKRTEPSEVMPLLDHHHTEGAAGNNSAIYDLFSSEERGDITINLSRLSVVLLSSNESGEVQKMTGMICLLLNSKPKDKKELSLNISQFKIHSQILKGNTESMVKKIRNPSSSYTPSRSMTSQSDSDDSSQGLQHLKRKDHISIDTSFSANVSGEEVENDSVCLVVQEIDENHILENFSAKLEIGHEVDCLNMVQGWAGKGSISSLNMTISLLEIKMLMDCIELLSEVSMGETPRSMKQRLSSSANIKYESNAEASVPDGAVIAVQDVYQHMYISVEQHELEENKFCLRSTSHYSLAGERALFKVKTRKRRKWNFQDSWFSLVSLHAKNEKGEPLQLSCCSGSGFVDISTSNDSDGALWKVVSCKSESQEGDTVSEPYYHSPKNTFYLVNKRNSCGVALVDGVLEFVKKPGNPFKLKMFDTPPSSGGLDRSGEMSGSNPVVVGSQNTHKRAVAVPCITFTVFDVNLIIVDQFSDSRGKFDLVKGSLSSIEVAIQILPHKARVMTKLIASLYYFDTHKVLWRELVYPFQIHFFYRRTFYSLDSATSFSGVPIILCVGMERMDLSVTELSLDILLYVVGKLDLAGPFAVKSSAIVANCCKLENQTGASLLCQFHDSPDVKVGRKQSALIPIRHIMNQPLVAANVSIKLETAGTFSTDSIQLPLSKSQTCAWRTRISSPEDGRTCPGPSVIFDISRNVEEGLSVVVSPILQIHNATQLSMELCFERPQQTDPASASLSLKSGDVIDDCLAAFEAANSSGGVKKAMLPLSVGNFLFSFRPDTRESSNNSNEHDSVGWSDTIEGGKAVRLLGIMDKIGYRVRKAFYTQPSKCSFSIASCSVMRGDSILSSMHFLVQSIIRDVPIIMPNNEAESSSSTDAYVQKREIFLLPTVRVYNLLQSDVHVFLSESDIKGSENPGNQATISCGSAAELYANPAMLCFNFKLVALSSSCKPVRSGDWIKKLNKKKDSVQFLDIDLDFCGGKYYTSLRLTRDVRGVLEAVVFTRYTLKNDTEFPLFCCMPHQKALPRDVIQQFGSVPPPHLGSFLPPLSMRSWFMRSNKLLVRLLDEESSQVTLDLDSLSGLTEISLMRTRPELRQLLKLGVSLGPLRSATSAPSEVVSIVPRYVVSNDSNEKISVRQCGYEDGTEGITTINSKQKALLLFVDGTSQGKRVGVFDKLLWKHRASNDDSSLLVQFRIDNTGSEWSGPICVASLGRFFLKFRRSSENLVHQLNISKQSENSLWDFAAVNVVEEASSFVLHFSRPPANDLPYRIENQLPNASVTYRQKDKFETETLSPGSRTSYVLDDLTCPHKLIVKVNVSLGYDVSREISLDKLRPWKPISRSWRQSFPSNKSGDGKQSSRHRPDRLDSGDIGYEIYADGPTRVLRFGGSRSNGKKGFSLSRSEMRIQLRFSSLAVQLLEQKKQDFLEDKDPGDLPVQSPIVAVRLEKMSLDSVFSDKQKYHHIRLQSINVDEKWPGAPFASLLRRHQLSNTSSESDVLMVVLVLNPGFSNVKQVKDLSILLQPINLNLDEETLLKIVPFWRKSLSQSTQSQQYYFDHFEIHPIKIITTFLPEESYSSYNSAQEALRTLLHSVIKIPAVKNAVVELNGVLVTHALVTTRELLIRCAQHYSWYAMRAVYIAKGSLLLPPYFASMFDDFASSSLDVFFDPSNSLLNVRGLTVGTFKLMSKYVKGEGFSGTKRYFGDLGQTLRTAGSNVLFTAVTEVSDSVLKGAESSGFNGMVIGFHQGILKLALEPSLLGTAFLVGGPDRKIELNRSPGVDELYIEGYLQAMLDAIYEQDYLRVRVTENEVILKNLPPNSALIDEIMDRVRDFLSSKGLLKGDTSTPSRPLRLLRPEKEWRFGPTVLTLCQHLFVSFTIRILRKQTSNALAKIRPPKPAGDSNEEEPEGSIFWRWGIGRFVLSALLAYVDGRLCRCIPHPVARRIVSGFLLSFLDKRDAN